jgi:type III restriction enzyme
VIQAPPISKTRLQWRKAGMEIGKAGVTAVERKGADMVVLNEDDIELPDILTELQNRTQLTRRSIGRILTESHRLNDFKRNPQQFIETVAEAINRCKRAVLVDGIRYQRLGDEAYYAQELFETEELTGYLKNMLLDTERRCTSTSSTTPTLSATLPTSCRRTTRSRSTPSFRAGSRCPRRWAATTRTGRCWWPRRG